MKSKIHEHLKTNKLIVSKTVSKYLMALLVITAISFAGCKDTKKEQDDHGHEHNEDGSHKNEHEEVKQEEFTVGKDSLKTEEKIHTHDNGEEHHDH